jgi:hypothetical protein
VDAAHLSLWVTILGGIVGLIIIFLGVFTYVWKDDRRRLEIVEKSKLDKTALADHKSDLKNDFQEVKQDIRDLRTLIITAMGVKKE